MRASTILPATLAATAGLGALANARAIPPPERAAKRAIAAQARPSAHSPPTLHRRSRSVDLGMQSNGTLVTNEQRKVDVISVSMTPPRGPEHPRKARSSSISSSRSAKPRSASIASSSSGSAEVRHDLLPRATYYTNNGDGRYLPNNSTCPETGIWDTRWHRCRTEQDGIDEQRKKEEDARKQKEFDTNFNIGMGVGGGVVGAVALTSVGTCIYRRRRRS